MSEERQPLPPFSEKAQASGTPAKMSTVRKRRRIKRIVKIAVWCFILAALAVGGYLLWRNYQQQQIASTAVAYQQTPVMMGTLDKYIYGTGNIQAASQPTVYAETSGTLSELRVDIGDTVSEGQILAVLKNDTLDEEIRQLEYDLWSLDSEITSTNAGTEVTRINAPVGGRVVALYAGVGDDTLVVYREVGSVAIISTDGRMRVDFEVDEQISLALGDVVQVVGEGFTAEATITDLYMQGTQATATVLDDTLPMDSAVTVLAEDGATVGTGTLVINKPMSVSAFGGTVQEVKVAVGDTVTRKQVLYNLEDSPNTLAMEDLRLRRESAAESLETAKESRENLIVRAPVDGVVATLGVSEGDSIDSGASLLSILEGEDMVLTIAVDELDVVSVEEGQSVNISIDALPDLTLTGTVEKISPVGSGDGGVTTYDVRLSFDSAGTGVRSGMNASGEVQVAHVENAVYVPAEALMTINNQQYVMVAEGGESGSGTLPVTDGGGLEGQGSPEGQASTDAGQPTGDGGMSFPARDLPEGMEMPDLENLSEEQREQMQGMRGGGGRGDGSGQQLALPGTTTEAGTLRAVETGIANDDYVQILSGVSVGEIVLYQSTSSSSSSNMMFMGGGGGGGAATISMPMGMF